MAENSDRKFCHHILFENNFPLEEILSKLNAARWDLFKKHGFWGWSIKLVKNIYIEKIVGVVKMIVTTKIEIEDFSKWVVKMFFNHPKLNVKLMRPYLDLECSVLNNLGTNRKPWMRAFDWWENYWKRNTIAQDKAHKFRWLQFRWLKNIYRLENPGDG